MTRQPLGTSTTRRCDFFTLNATAKPGKLSALGLTAQPRPGHPVLAVVSPTVGRENPVSKDAHPLISRLGVFLRPRYAYRVMAGDVWARFGVAGSLCPGFSPCISSVAISVRRDATAPNLAKESVMANKPTPAQVAPENPPNGQIQAEIATSAEQFAAGLIRKIKRQASRAKSKAKRELATASPKPATPILEYHNDQEYASHRLPFIGRTPGGKVSYWAVPTVPKSGLSDAHDYVIGCDVGGSLALIYVHHILKYDPRENCGLLQLIALDMFGGDNTMDLQRKGEIIGFFTTLEKLFRGVMLKGGLTPAAVSNGEHLSRVNNVLAARPWEGGNDESL
jgi:hypothetical protein